MPCYVMAANRLGVRVSMKMDRERIEEYLLKQLRVPTNRHKDLSEAINRMLTQDPEVLRIILIEAVAYAGEKKRESPPDRLNRLRKKGPWANKEVEATS